MSQLSFYYPELKYDSSNPNDFIGFVPLERLDATPKPTRTFFNRPSQSNAISYMRNQRLSSYFPNRACTRTHIGRGSPSFDYARDSVR